VPRVAQAGLDQAIQTAFASGLNAVLVISGVAGLIGAVIVAVALRPSATAEPAVRGETSRPGATEPPRLGAPEPQRSAAGQTSR
jgi:hypothetical protein